MGRFNPTPEQITAWVTKRFPDHKLRKGGREINICSPFDSDTGYNFSVGTNGFVHDWRGDCWCAVNPRSGKRNLSFVNFVQQLLKCCYHEAVRAIVEASGDAMPALGPSEASRVAPDAKETPRMALPDGSHRLLESPEPHFATLVRRWLKTRGVGEEEIERYDIYHCLDCVVFPYYEFDNLVYWQSRAAITKEFRFPDEKVCGVKKSQFLYNFDQVEPASYVVIVEAIFGCLTLEEQTLATGGAAMTAQQVRKLHLLGPRDGVILAPDNDVAGLESVNYNAELLEAEGFKVFYSIPPRLAYQDSSGKRKFTKDLNELITDMRLTKRQVRAEFEKGLKPYNIAAKVELCRRVAELKAKH